MLLSQGAAVPAAEAEDRKDRWVPIGLFIHSVWERLSPMVSSPRTPTLLCASTSVGDLEVLVCLLARQVVGFNHAIYRWARLGTPSVGTLRSAIHDLGKRHRYGGCGRVHSGEMDTGAGPNSTPYTDIPGATPMDASAHVAEVGQQPHVVLTLLPKNTNVVLADTPGVTHKMLV
jgi:hypothetical protein